MTMNGQLYLVRAGRWGTYGDLGEGILTVSVFGPDNRYHDIGTYLTPYRQGPVEIAALDGTRVYLDRWAEPQPPGINWQQQVTPVPNFVFVFDLATLQWVSP